MSKLPYVNVINSLMYAMFYIRRDISFAVGMFSRFQNNLGLAH